MRQGIPLGATAGIVTQLFDPGSVSVQGLGQQYGAFYQGADRQAPTGRFGIEQPLSGARALLRQAPHHLDGLQPQALGDQRLGPLQA
ncbi:hypothetical protein AO284_29150 [Pseudomonas sp. NZIPFR-PS2]|nr:hypothetical protein AO284_29150 [Pseudomonas sp. NZIPFR-PS2]